MKQSRPSKFLRFFASLTLVLSSDVQAFNFGNMMNPSTWGNNNNRNNDYYDYGPGYGAPVYGYGAPGYGYGGQAYGYPPPAYGYGAPAYGMNPAVTTTPSYAVPDYNSPRPATDNTDDKAEIERLKQRVKELEKARTPIVSTPARDWQQETPNALPPVLNQPLAQQPTTQINSQTQYQFRPLEAD